MNSKKELILRYMENVASNSIDPFMGFTTTLLSEQLEMQRSNVSTLLNEMVRENLIVKSNGRPVLYHLVKKTPTHKESINTFQKLIGYNQSLENCVKLAKASLLYPNEEGSINSLIIGAPGSGKTYFATLMYEYAIDEGILTKEAPLVTINCNYYSNNEHDFIQYICEEQAKNGMLLIDNIELLSPKCKKELYEMLTLHKNEHRLIVCTSNKQSESVADARLLREIFPIHIEMPALNERTWAERMELVEHFFMAEATQMNKDIIVNSELLRCFLLYYCEENIKQLKNDIKVGCANAFVRNIDIQSNTLNVIMRDCQPYIRKGFIFYKENRTEIEQLIPNNYTYTFTSTYAKKREEALIKNESPDSIYEVIEQKVAELRKREIKEEDIMTLVSADIESDLQMVKRQLDASQIDRNVLVKVVDARIIDLVEDFLKEASTTFNRVYSISTFYSICLHLSACLKRKSWAQNLSNEKIMEIVEKYKNEYTLSTKFASKIEKTFNLRLSIDEVIYFTLFLSHSENKNQAKLPSLLIVMHGTIASAIANTVNHIYRDQKVYAYDLLLDKDTQSAYEELKNYCKQMDNSGGLLILYDMGSVKQMCEMVVQELGIHAKMIELPITVLALDCAIKLSHNSVEDVYNNVISHGSAAFNTLLRDYSNIEKDKHRIIFTTCATGERTAIQVKEYLEKYIDTSETRIIAIADKDKVKLLKEINYYKAKNEILCIIGPNDPMIHDIPYISIAKIFDTPVDKLSMLLALKEMNVSSYFDYEPMYDYLKEKLTYIDIKLLRKYIPQILTHLQQCTANYSQDLEIGLLMHISCSINQIKAQEETPVNVHKKNIINKHKRLYNELIDIFEPIQKAMDFTFNDDDIATIIEIII